MGEEGGRGGGETHSTGVRRGEKRDRRKDSTMLQALYPLKKWPNKTIFLIELLNVLFLCLLLNPTLMMVSRTV